MKARTTSDPDSGAATRPEWWTSGRRGGSFEDAAPRACACVEDCGAFGTVISNAKWFPKPWRVRGFPGVVDLAVPADLVGGAAAVEVKANSESTRRRSLSMPTSCVLFERSVAMSNTTDS